MLCSLVSNGNDERPEGNAHGNVEFGADTDLDGVMSRWALADVSYTHPRNILVSPTAAPDACLDIDPGDQLFFVCECSGKRGRGRGSSRTGRDARRVRAGDSDE